MKKAVWCIVGLLLLGCAKDNCKDGECYEIDPDVEWGTSLLLAVEPGDGEIRWGAVYQGEFITLEGLRDSGKQVVLDVDDACWDEPHSFAFSVEKGSEVEIVDDVPSSVVECDGVGDPDYEQFTMVDGVCIGINKSEEALFAGIDVFTGELLWTEQVLNDTFFLGDDVFLTSITQEVSGSELTRISRISPVTGKSMWNYQQEKPLAIVGAGTSNAFLVSDGVLALSLNSGDVAWETPVEDVELNPETDGGMVLDDTVFITGQYITRSPCSE